MNEQIKKRIKALENQFPSIDDFTMVTVTFADGSTKEMLWVDVVNQLDSADICKIEGRNQDTVNLLYALMGVERGTEALE